MKISDLKQPYRRMAEYLAEKNINPRRRDKTILINAFDWCLTNNLFWDEIYNGNYPEITHEIKTHFPPNFDFSGEVEDERRYNFAFKNNMEEKYTQLAKEGKFEKLPDTCEFSEPVELEVGDDNVSKDFRKITGKYKGNYMDIHCVGWKNAQLPKPEIDFSQYNPGDILEITNKDNEKYYGLLHLQTINELIITFSYKSNSCKHITKDNILSIDKLK